MPRKRRLWLLELATVLVGREALDYKRRGSNSRTTIPPFVVLLAWYVLRSLMGLFYSLNRDPPSRITSKGEEQEQKTTSVRKSVSSSIFLFCFVVFFFLFLKCIFVWLFGWVFFVCSVKWDYNVVKKICGKKYIKTRKQK